jgi:hypothetical protein
VGWINLEESAVLAQTLFDLVAYNFYVESYSTCRQYLQILSTINPTVLKKYIDTEVMDGYRCALNIEKIDIDANTTDDRRVNLELSAWASCSGDLGQKLSQSNSLMRLEKSYPPNLEFFIQQQQQQSSASTAPIRSTDFKSRFLQGLSSQSELEAIVSYDSGKIDSLSCVSLYLTIKYSKSFFLIIKR